MTRPSYAADTWTLQPGEAFDVHRYADFLVCLEALAPFEIAFDAGPATGFEKGLTYETNTPFAKVRIINTHTAAQAIRLGFGAGGINDSRLSLTGAVNTRPQGAEILSTGAPVIAADAATTQLAAENTARREIVMVNDGSGKIYVGGDSGAAAGEGLPVEAGQSITLDTTAAVYARNDTGGAINVAVAEIEEI